MQLAFKLSFAAAIIATDCFGGGAGAGGGHLDVDFSEVSADANADTSAYRTTEVSAVDQSGVANQSFLTGVLGSSDMIRTFTITLRGAPEVRSYEVVTALAFTSGGGASDVWISYLESPSTGGADRGWQSTAGGSFAIESLSPLTIRLDGIQMEGSGSSGGVGAFVISGDGSFDEVRTTGP